MADTSDAQSLEQAPLYQPPSRLQTGEGGVPVAHIKSMDEYWTMYEQSIRDPDTFFGKMAQDELSWSKPFNRVRYGDFKRGNVSWFLDGQINVSYNCVDRHALANPDRVAIIWEADEPNQHTHITYGQLLEEVSRIANVLRKYGVRKGDSVAIYMPMVPEAVYSMLACARLGAVHSVVFAGFSADALRDRILDAGCKVLITADQGKRGGKTIQLKKIADEALGACPSVQRVIVFQRTGDPSVPFYPPRDVWWHNETANQRPYCPLEPMDSEDPLFMLYTSGSTGKPKGVVHTTAGYLLGAHITCKYVFDLHEDDVHGCMADVGWITGHTYIVYGPLSNGATTVLFESVPTYPNASRYWEMVDKHKITQFYTAPTAIRALRRLGDEFVSSYDLSTLRIIASVGEPINPEAWSWYYTVVGRERCALVDTYWQTETGSHIISPIPGAVPTKPGSATLPFFGIDPAVLDSQTGQELQGNNVTGVLAIRSSFPSVTRTVYDSHIRYMDTYLKPYPGYYFTGDGVTRDQDGYYWIRGRVDDVINVSGHRMSTAEIESALILHHACAEAAAIGVPDDVTGQAVVCFVTLKPDITQDENTIRSAFVATIRHHIGPFASPKRIIICGDLPKTRSGKIMRRVLRKIAGGDVTLADLDDEQALKNKLGDLSTLADSNIIGSLVKKVIAH